MPPTRPNGSDDRQAVVALARLATVVDQERAARAAKKPLAVAAGEAGAKPKEIAGIVGRSEKTIYAWLNQARREAGTR